MHTRKDSLAQINALMHMDQLTDRRESKKKELEAFEAQFEAKNGRKPTKQEKKQDQKYKRDYKAVQNMGDALQVRGERKAEMAALAQRQQDISAKVAEEARLRAEKEAQHAKEVADNARKQAQQLDMARRLFNGFGEDTTTIVKLHLDVIHCSSEHHNGMAEKLVDGETGHGHCWESEWGKHEHQHIDFDCSAEMHVSMIRVISTSFSFLAPHHMKLQASENGHMWGIGHTFEGTATREWQEFKGFSLQGRYFRLWLLDTLDTDDGDHMHLDGVELYGNGVVYEEQESSFTKEPEVADSMVKFLAAKKAKERDAEQQELEKKKQREAEVKKKREEKLRQKAEEEQRRAEEEQQRKEEELMQSLMGPSEAEADDKKKLGARNFLGMAAFGAAKANAPSAQPTQEVNQAGKKMGAKHALGMAAFGAAKPGVSNNPTAQLQPQTAEPSQEVAKRKLGAKKLLGMASFGAAK